MCIHKIIRLNCSNILLYKILSIPIFGLEVNKRTEVHMLNDQLSSK